MPKNKEVPLLLLSDETIEVNTLGKSIITGWEILIAIAFTHGQGYMLHPSCNAALSGLEECLRHQSVATNTANISTVQNL